MAGISFDVMLETLDEWNHPERYSNPFLLKNIDMKGIRL